MAVISYETAFIDNPDHIPIDAIPDNFVSYTIKHQDMLPPVTSKNWYKEVNWLQLFILVIPPTIGIIGAWYIPLRVKTAIWLWIHIYFTGFGTPLSLTRQRTLTEDLQGLGAGYHRLWSHRAYKATRTLEYVLAILGAGAVQGPIAWWAKRHRAHHRYTDTDLDPYDARKGFFYTHIGWMIFKSRRKPGPVDVSDLRSNPVVKWQHKYYFPLAFIMAIAIPICVAGYGWGDWQGGFVWASMLRLVYVHHVSILLSDIFETDSNNFQVHFLRQFAVPLAWGKTIR